MILYYLFYISYVIVNIPVLLFGIISKLLFLDSYYTFKYYYWTLRKLYGSCFTIEIINKEHYENVFNKERCIYVMNHQTYDAYLLVLSRQKVSCCVRSWSLYIPIVGPLWYLLQFVFVKKDTVNAILKRLKSDDSLSLAIFPEGTRNSECIFRPDKVRNGAFIIAKELNLPLMPFYHTLGLCINDSKKHCVFLKASRLW